MFLTRMVSGFLDTKKNNHSQSQQSEQQTPPSSQPSSKMPNKSPKKLDKRKRSNTKKTITEFFKTSAKDVDNEKPSTSKTTINTETSLKSSTSTKVKSASWKRSDKSNASCNALTNKKTKALRRRSPNWLKFPSAPVKINDKIINATDTTSVCRPGTLYSDVLFAAGTSSLVKVKTLTPRRSGDTAQKKLTKALFKFSGGETNNETPSDDSDMEVQRNKFPSLHQLSHAKTPSGSYSTKTTTMDVSSTSDSPVKTTVTSSSTKNDSYEGADVVILSDRNDSPTEESAVSYGSYLDQQFQQLYVSPEKNADSFQNPMHPSSESHGQSVHKDSVPAQSKFRIDIPQWNFTDVDTSSESFPKFLGQFDDERYLKAEKLALLSLNLALGNRVG